MWHAHADRISRFVSGVYYYSRGSQLEFLENTPPDALTPSDMHRYLNPKHTIAHGRAFDAFEYTAVLSLLPNNTDLEYRAQVAIRNLERDVSVIGTTEEMDRFFVLITLELEWPKDTFSCFSPRNVRGVSGPNSASEKRRVTEDDLNPQTLKYVQQALRPETEFYEYAKALHFRQAGRHPQFDEHLSGFRKRCSTKQKSAEWQIVKSSHVTNLSFDERLAWWANLSASRPRKNKNATRGHNHNRGGQIRAGQNRLRAGNRTRKAGRNVTNGTRGHRSNRTKKKRIRGENGNAKTKKRGQGALQETWHA